MRQKSRVQWLTQGDQNTKFFHSAIKEIRNKNRIFSVIDAQRSTKKEPGEVAEAFIGFCKNLLGIKSRKEATCMQ